jgi:regulatory protein
MTEETQAALKRALRRLETSDRYESEVRSALSGYAEPIVDEVVAILKEKRLLNDARTASNALASNSGRRAVGAGRIRERMERRGAPENLVEASVAQVAEGDAERAVLLLESKFPERAPEARPRAGRFLFGRGFDEAVVETALNGHFGELE